VDRAYKINNSLLSFNNDVNSSHTSTEINFQRLKTRCPGLSVLVLSIILRVRDVIPYVGETCRHISTRVLEHIFTDKSSHVYKHLQSSKTCKDSCDESCFKVIDSAKMYHQLKVKEALHILWEGPNLNKHVQYDNFSLTF